MRSSKQRSSGLPEVRAAPLATRAQAAAAAVKLERQPVALLVEPVVQAEDLTLIAVAGRSGVEEVYGVPYLDVGCDVWVHVCRIHHFSPLITAIRRRPYQPGVSLSIPLPQDLEGPNRHKMAATTASWVVTTDSYQISLRNVIVTNISLVNLGVGWKSSLTYLYPLLLSRPRRFARLSAQLKTTTLAGINTAPIASRMPTVPSWSPTPAPSSKLCRIPASE